MVRIGLLLSVVFLSVGPAFGLRATGGYSAPYFQADYIQDLTEFSAGVVNPALLYRVNQFRLEGGWYWWGLGRGDEDTKVLGYRQVSFLSPIRLRQTAGMTLISSTAPIERSVLSRVSHVPKGTGEFLDYGERWLVGHYGIRVLPWLMLGANPKLVIQNQFDSHGHFGVGLDFGVYVNPLDHYRYGDLGISLNFQDIIPARVTWEDTSVSIDQRMTTRFRGGIRYAAMNDRLVVGVETVIDNLFSFIWETLIDESEKGNYVYDTTYDDNGVVTSIDSPYVDASYLKTMARVSCHARFQWIPQVWFKVGWANNNIPYIGFNLNVIYPFPEMINYASIDVHVGYSVNEKERGLASMLKVATDFGPTREQRESRHLYDKLILAPMSAYNEAMRLYLAERYWEAGFAFGKVLSLFPNFHLNDKATFYLGDCYTQLYLNDISREIFKEALAEYTTSEVRPKFLYGLQRLDYREGKYEDALKNHAFISNLYGDSDIRPDADYLAGEVHFLRKNYNASQKLLSAIPPEAPTYLYAQYTLAVINIESGRTKAAIQNLVRVVSDTTTDAAEVFLLDAANNKLGQLYFEEVELRKAVEAFKQVPEGGAYGDEALLGTAWSWIKVNRPEQSLVTVGRLLSLHPKSALVPEAYLVRGYCLMLMKRHSEAVDALEECLRRCKSDFADDNDLGVRKGRFDGYVREFAPTSQTIKKNSLRKPTDKTLGARAGLKAEYGKYYEESKSFFAFKILVESNKRFFRRKEQILMDAEYALAKASKILGVRDETEIIERDLEKQEKLDTEIEKLEQQLERLDAVE